MILNFNTFILEAFTKEVSSINNFLKKYNKNSDQFFEILKHDCDRNDFLLSSIKGDYLSKRQVNRLPNKSSNDLLIYWFSIDDGYLYRTYGVEGDNLKADFALVFDKNEQKTGARELRSNRSDQKDGSHFGKSDYYWRMDNLKRYKNIIYDRKYPERLESIFRELLSYSIRYNISPMEALDRARYGMDRRLFNDLMDRLYDSGYNFGHINYSRYDKYGYKYGY